MKSHKMFVCLLLALFSITSFCIPARAAETKYKVTVSGGLHGTVNGSAYVEAEYTAGEIFRPGDFTVAVNANEADKYYFKGFHISGQETFFGASPVDRDIVLVASYGVVGDMVNYIVHYMTTNGQRLHADDILSGKVGDKPIVSARYVDNYTPNAYNYSFTLQAGQTREVTFYYTAIPAPTAPAASSRVTNSPAASNAQNNAAVNNAQGEQQANVMEETAGQGEQQVNAMAETASQGEQQVNAMTETAGLSEFEQPANTNPPEIIDLDEQDASVAAPSDAEGTVGAEVQEVKKRGQLAIGIGAAGGLLTLAGVGYIIAYRKRNKKQ